MTRRALDQYYTSEKLLDELLTRVNVRGTVLEPTSGLGAVVTPLREAGCKVYTNDIDPKSIAVSHEDATDPNAAIWKQRYDWVVTNPPFSQAGVILPLAYEAATKGVAFLLRLTFLEPTQKRSGWLKEHRRHMSDLIIFSQPRPSFTANGNTDSATVAWMVWRKNWQVATAIDFVTGWNR